MDHRVAWIAAEAVAELQTMQFWSPRERQLTMGHPEAPTVHDKNEEDDVKELHVPKDIFAAVDSLFCAIWWFIIGLGETEVVKSELALLAKALMMERASLEETAMKLDSKVLTMTHDGKPPAEYKSAGASGSVTAVASGEEELIEFNKWWVTGGDSIEIYNNIQ